MPTLSAHRARLWLRLLLVSLLCAACGSGCAPSVRLLQPAHAAVLGESGRPIIQMGLLQYFNPAGHALNYSGYELDAMEMKVAVELAVADLNSGRFASAGVNTLSAYEVQLDTRNAMYTTTQSAMETTDLIDPRHNEHPPAVVLGFLGYDEAYAAAVVSQPYQTPLLTSFVSTPSLSASFPNFNRYCPTDQLEAFALLAMFNVLNWRRVGAIFNTEGGSAQLVQVLTQFGPAFVPGFDLTTQSYSFGLSDASDFPDVRTQLRVFKDSGVRVILLSAFASDTEGVLSAAADLGMIGAPYTWVGSSQVCFDSTVWSDPRTSHLMDGFLCSQSSVDESTQFYREFQRSWAEAYERDPASVYHIRTPSLSGNAYDSVFGAARAMQTVLDLRAACNLSDTGGLGTDMPLSGLLPPSLREFNPYLYSPNSAGVSGQNMTFTQAVVPTTYPDVCPWLMYQVGQGRVLNKVLRSQFSVGATGVIIMMESGDRVGDISFHNIHSARKKRVATVSGLRTMALLLEGILGDLLYNLTSLNASSLIDASEGMHPMGMAPPEVTGNSSWRASYDPESFRPYGYYETTSQLLALLPGRVLGRGVFSDLQLDAMRFADGTGTIPLDAPLRVELVEPISRNAWIAVLSLTGIVAFYNLALLFFQLWYRKHKLIKITAPKMNVVFLCGSMGILVYIVLLGLDSTQLGDEHRYIRLCHAKYAVLAISFSLAFGSLFAKTYRLDAIFNSKHLHVHVVKDRDILLMVLRLIVLDILILVIWGAESPFYRSLSQDDPVLNPFNFNELQVPTRESCGSDNFTTYVIAFLVYKGVLLMFGLYLALRVRKIKVATLNDSKWIVMSIYNVTMISVLLIPVSIVVGDDPDTFYLLVSLALLYLVTSVLSLLFLPRVLTLCCNVDMFGTAAGGATGGAGGAGGAVDSRDTASSSDMLRSEMAKLKQRLTQAHSDLNEARKQMHTAGLTLVLEARPSSHGPGGGGGSGGIIGSPSQNGAGSQYRITGPSPQIRSKNLAPGAGAATGGARTPTPSQSRRIGQHPGHVTSPSFTGHTLPVQTVRIHVHGGGGGGGGGGSSGGSSGGGDPGLGSSGSERTPVHGSSPPPLDAGRGSEVEMRAIIGGATAPLLTDPHEESAAMRAALAGLPGAAVANSLVQSDGDEALLAQPSPMEQQ